jgi:hypothetical protein
VASRLASLSDDRVHAGRSDGSRVLDRCNHRDDFDAALVAAAHHLRTRIAEADAPDRNPLLQDHLEGLGNEVRDARRTRESRRDVQALAETVQRPLNDAHALLRNLRDVGRRAQLGVQPEVDPERPVGELAHAADLCLQVLSLDSQPREDAEPTRLAHLGDELRSGDASHPRLENRVFDPEKVVAVCRKVEARLRGVRWRFAPTTPAPLKARKDHRSMACSPPCVVERETFREEYAHEFCPLFRPRRRISQ